jgi:hypothetical protein
LTTIEIIFIAIGAVLLYILYYIFTKDAEIRRHIRSIAMAVEDVNRQIYLLERKVYELQNNTTFKAPERRMNDEEIYAEIERGVYDLLNPLSKKLSMTEQNLSDLASAVDSRLSHLEGGIRQIAMPSSVHGNDDAKITSLFKQGIDLDTISKELHLSKAEVEFVLKINQLR